MPGCDNRTNCPSDALGEALPMVRVAAAARDFGGRRAVFPISFTVPGKCILGLVGSDGAGKTTLLRMIAAMLTPTAGRIFISGLDAVARKKAVKPLIGYMPQRFGLYQDLTVIENFDFFLDVFGITGGERRERRERYLGFSNLLPFTHRLAGDLSGGMKQKLQLACVLAHHPRLLVLDEPTNGVDPVSRQEFWDILIKMRREGMTVIVATAYLDEGEKCDRLILMHNARALENASPREFRAGFPDLEHAMIHRILAADRELAHERFDA